MTLFAAIPFAPLMFKHHNLSTSAMSSEAAEPAGAPQDHEAGDYLRQVAVRDAFNDTYLLHWPKRKMPLAVYLHLEEGQLRAAVGCHPLSRTARAAA